ncbi:MAG: phosphoenolpyruvate synthase [Prevotellaceae bacterium]|jgi:CheY-like chemotaxis protein|nr:phosphoenolpyruvate synthase [Prevotellaceae bacterium]
MDSAQISILSSHLYFKDTSFASLMNRRIYNILLIASRYDVFMLEDDGRVDEQIFNEYVSLNLRYPPRFTQAATRDEALALLQERPFELIISMLGGDSDTFEQAKRIKAQYPSIPIVVLTPFSRAVSQRIANEDLSAIDYVFSWLGNANLLMAIIKLIEDRMNVESDVSEAGVQVLLFVEDSIRFYSSILPHLYQIIFKQSRSFMTEALNDHQRMLRMRGRPKIMLARTYEEAIATYDRYRDNMLGVISDTSFERSGKKDRLAGVSLCRYIRSIDRFVPFLLQSSESNNVRYAREMGVGFIDKNSKTLELELREHMTDGFGFGDFVFRDPHTGQEVARAATLRDLQDKIFSIPDSSLAYHISNNHISRWLYSRAMFPVAEFLRRITFRENGSLDEVRQTIFDAIVQYRKIKNRGVVAVFQRDRFDRYSNFARIGEGSMGGKARGLAFLDALIKRNAALGELENLCIAIPKTVVLCTDIFDEFMEQNNLYPVALSDISDEEMLQRFLDAQLPGRLTPDFLAFIEAIDSPIAVRSSSLLEDSHYQPFAGIYSTYMIPYTRESKTGTLNMLYEAIKGVYASVFFKDSKAYMAATSNVIDSEKMAIVLQEVCGSAYGRRYYPSFSGVARSINFYPIAPEQPEDGVANIALGLGKYIVDGGVTLRFSPNHPQNILQLSTLDLALRETQTKFYALDLAEQNASLQTDDAYNLLKLPTSEAQKDGTLRLIASTYDPADQVIRDGLYEGGRKIISFANILQHDAVPIARALSQVLRVGHSEMARHVELEFAVTLSYDSDTPSTLYLLQIRPVVDSREVISENLADVPQEHAIITAESALGHGIITDVYDVVYVKTEKFSASNNQLTAYDIEKINRQLVGEGRGYVLVGPGRWGSSDTSLGIPVKWPHISGARLIVEAGLTAYRIDPSQGTHFFHNLTSLHVGYFTVNSYLKEGGGFYDVGFLDAQPAVAETDYIRHVRFSKPVVIKIDGKKSLGVVMKPAS